MKLLQTAIMLITLASTSAFAQHTYHTLHPSPGKGNSMPTYNYNYDDLRFDRHLDWWDSELDLSRRQLREIRQIREYFRKQTEFINPNDPSQKATLRLARKREFSDMMALLHPDQRNQVIERMRPYERIIGQNRIAGQNKAHRYERRHGPTGY